MYVHLSLSDNDTQPKLVVVKDSKYIIPPPSKSLIHRLSESLGLGTHLTQLQARNRILTVSPHAHDAQGGALVDLIHSYTDNGEPFVRKFTDQLLEEVSTPFFNTLHNWLFSGGLYDPHSEFFLSVGPSLAHLQGLHPSSLAVGIDTFGEDSVSADKSGGRDGFRIWEAKYHFRMNHHM
ncbi:hypothetical protein CY34DRAFT_19280 [Suillus luteus UH-Slu-Lm8-n1]|uniref:Gamma tubulin complex component protein N-terminal domain-containing protein n=1 Tax=Suillus luteus UH-Slu-Lm8-n1 TaxID=930992 RepID=A0A0D0A1T5_9AGAM|nr:hypothetical protein CY34DRAFT_19280 [Suillus luteus UH-Slu-Lm8-n1]